MKTELYGPTGPRREPPTLRGGRLVVPLGVKDSRSTTKGPCSHFGNSTTAQAGWPGWTTFPYSPTNPRGHHPRSLYHPFHPTLMATKRGQDNVKH